MRQHDYDDGPAVVIEKHTGGVGAFLFGLAVGAGVALLLAPQAGIDTRRVIARRARDARDQARDAADDVTTRVTDRFDRARTAVETRVATARDAVDLRRRQVQRAVEAGRAAAEQAREDLERRIAETKAAYQAGARVAREGAGDEPYDELYDGPRPGRAEPRVAREDDEHGAADIA
jgi:gas vesicle protein